MSVTCYTFQQTAYAVAQDLSHRGYVKKLCMLESKDFIYCMDRY